MCSGKADLPCNNNFKSNQNFSLKPKNPGVRYVTSVTANKRFESRATNADRGESKKNQKKKTP